MIKWQYFPKSKEIPSHLLEVVKAFIASEPLISSSKFSYESNAVLQKVSANIAAIGYDVETSKAAADKIMVPVLFGLNGKPIKSFDADAYNKITRTVLEIEAGRAVVNFQFLKDLFQACMMYSVDYLAIAVRIIYRKSQDFDRMIAFLDTLYASQRLQLPLTGVLAIGY